MTDEEIRISYTQAKYKYDQIQVIADLNVKTRNEAEWKLWEMGLLDKKPRKPRVKQREPVKRTKYSTSKSAQNARKRRELLKQAGKCVWCGRKITDGKTLCAACREIARKKSQVLREKQKASNQKQEDFQWVQSIKQRSLP